ncbi:MAG TPA: exonuclease domain-containing protein [Pyrinomonadaceae bacterium]
MTMIKSAAAMPAHQNLILDSDLIQDLIEFLKANGGSLRASAVADQILLVPTLNEEFAALLVSDLIAFDSRIRFKENYTLELNLPDTDALKLAETEFIVFDTETTGAKPPYSRMTEIGCYKIKNGEIVDEFETLLNPQTPIPPFISALTGITDKMVARAPLFSEVAADLLNFIGDAVLVAHNAAFDIKFLNAEICRTFKGCKVANTHLCTVRLSRKLLPDLANHRLHTVAEHFSIPIYNRHRAGGDALATAKIFVNLLEDLQRLGIADVGSARKFKV